MVSELQFFRKATEAEKSEYIELAGGKNTSILNVFSAKLATVQQVFQKAFKPFDSFGARMDFEASIREKSGDSSILYQPAENFKFNVDLESYGQPERFEFVGVKDTVEDKLLDGIRQPKVVGKHYDFKGKVRRNGITVYVPLENIEEMDKWVEDNFGDKPVKEKVETTVSKVVTKKEDK